ncbi:MAG: LPS export ABC transporter periplasmic protein LptC [Candidatus Binatia bacterium]|nr:LPS export ABC transporter periplasmic protein LptC [Candidatus Binatia bacterium]
MAVRRARLRIALIVIVLSVLTGIGFLIGQTMLQQRRVAERTAETLLAPEIAQSIRQFHRVKVEEGRTVWDLRATKADFLEEGRVIVEVPELSFYSDDGQSVSLSGATGEVVLDGPGISRIDLSGGIEVSVGQYRLETPEASWIDELNTVVASSGVDLRGGRVELTGDTMILELETRRVLVVGRVKTILTHPAEPASENESSPDAQTAPVDPGAAASVHPGDETVPFVPGGESALSAPGGESVPSAEVPHAS